jgi:hypothetical protein
MSSPRPTSPKPPTFPTGSAVAFDFQGETFTGTFVRRFTIRDGARSGGIHYEITVDGRRETIFANGTTGRTVRAI